MPFNRTNATAYAHLYWDIPCDDGLIAVKSSSKGLSVEEAFRKKMVGENRSDWQAAFIIREKHEPRGEDAWFVPAVTPTTRDNVLFALWEDINDCAHYVVKCLQAGGISLQDIGAVPQLEKKLRGLGNTKTLANKLSTGAAQRVLDTQLSGSPILKKGDVILYAKRETNNLFHSALYLGEGKIACHTESRRNSFWNIYSQHKVSLIHFSDDDPAPSSSQINWLPGWWEVDWKGSKYYYYYARSGRVSYSRSKPLSTNAGNATPVGKGYWFRESERGYLIVWRKTGAIERFELIDSKTQVGKWNNQDALTAKRLGP
jgi:hypothetical protein